MRALFRSLPNSFSSAPSGGWNPTPLVWLASAWISTVGNWPLWLSLHALPEMATPRGKLSLLAFSGLVFALTAFTLTLAAWRRSVKPVIAIFLLTAAAGAHFMGSYNIVIDVAMMVNVLQTNLHETRDLLNPRLFVSILWRALLPLAWLWKKPVQSAGALAQIRRNLLSLLGAAALFAALLLLVFADVSSTLRNQHTLRYKINPLNTFYALAMVGVEAHQPAGPPVAVGEDAKLPLRPENALPPLLMLVIAETARADHFALNGYGRPTNPELSTLDVLSFRQATSCGTSTATSLPCMFSVFGKGPFEAESQPHENLLDVLQRAGLAVLWIDNQAGCKGVCNRVAHAKASDFAIKTPPPPNSLCHGRECLDEALCTAWMSGSQPWPEAQRLRGVGSCCIRWAATARPMPSDPRPIGNSSCPSARPTYCSSASERS